MKNGFCLAFVFTLLIGFSTTSNSGIADVKKVNELSNTNTPIKQLRLADKHQNDGSTNTLIYECDSFDSTSGKNFTLNCIASVQLSHTSTADHTGNTISSISTANCSTSSSISATRSESTSVTCSNNLSQKSFTNCNIPKDDPGFALCYNDSSRRAPSLTICKVNNQESDNLSSLCFPFDGQ